MANLRGADLTGANLQYANLGWAKLIQTKLTGVDIKIANLRGTDLEKANLVGVKLILVNLGGADLQVIHGLPETNEGRRQALNDWIKPLLTYSIDLDGANLPSGFEESCTEEIDKESHDGNSCPAEGGWTITYTDQPEFEPKGAAQ